MWDLFRSIPSIEDENHTVLDEYYWLNKADPNYSLCRATRNRGEDAHTDGKFGLSDKAAMEIMRLFMTPDEGLYDKKITDFFDDEVLNSNFWMYWRTMFAFENWHSALETVSYTHLCADIPAVLLGDFQNFKFVPFRQPVRNAQTGGPGGTVHEDFVLSHCYTPYFQRLLPRGKLPPAGG